MHKSEKVHQRLLEIFSDQNHKKNILAYLA